MCRGEPWGLAVLPALCPLRRHAAASLDAKPFEMPLLSFLPSSPARMVNNPWCWGEAAPPCQRPRVRREHIPGKWVTGVSPAGAFSLPYPAVSSPGEKGLLVWGRRPSQAGECWASSSSSSMPWLGVAGRALGRRPAHWPSHLLPAQTHRLPLKRLHLKGEMAAKGRQEPGGCPVFGRGWLVPHSAVVQDGGPGPQQGV